MKGVLDFAIPGGVHPPGQKASSATGCIVHIPLPKLLKLPLYSRLNGILEPCVPVGAQVLKGQLIAQSTQHLLHAPSSGTVRSIELCAYPDAQGTLVPTLCLETDGKEQWTPLTPCPNFLEQSAALLLEKIHCAGIEDLGGAGFPTAQKLQHQPDAIHTLIINGAECEPYISADDALMRYKTQELLIGIDILVHLLAPRQVFIGVEDNKPDAIEALQKAIDGRSYQIVSIPTRYPSGGEKQLIYLLTGREVPSQALPAALGVVCQNVATCLAIHDAVVFGQPLIQRITTVTGAAVQQPMNVQALIGTPMRALLEHAGLLADTLHRLIMGGPMMGIALPALDLSLLKTTNCLLAATALELPEPPEPQPCIRCGACAEVCPAGLLPQQLLLFAQKKQVASLTEHQLLDCIECGACAYVCPSHIPLVAHYRSAKTLVHTHHQEALQRVSFAERFNTRQARLAQEHADKEAQRQARAGKHKVLEPPQSLDKDTQATLKALKIASGRAEMILKKAQQQLAKQPTAERAAQVAALEAQHLQAQQALAQAETQAAQAVSGIYNERTPSCS